MEEQRMLQSPWKLSLNSKVKLLLKFIFRKKGVQKPWLQEKLQILTHKKCKPYMLFRPVLLFMGSMIVYFLLQTSLNFHIFCSYLQFVDRISLFVRRSAPRSGLRTIWDFEIKFIWRLGIICVVLFTFSHGSKSAIFHATTVYQLLS